MDEKIETLLKEMTLEEKISMLAGADMWRTVPVKRLGIPTIKVTDGPNGARGIGDSSGPTSACFPVGTALGATWNPDLVQRVGSALGEEVKAKGAHILLAPTVNIHRSPLAGRNFECYSEDPYLTGRMAVAYIKGLQSQGVGACIKHFVCNDSEFERHSLSSEVSERALREIYLPPFRAAIHESMPWSVMSAYNKVNGTWCCENKYLLRDILKGEWGFNGIVVSDWMGTYTPKAAAGGMDLEMPGPARWMGEPVKKALEAGELSVAEIDDKVRRILRTLERAGVFDDPVEHPEQAIDKPEHRQLARQAAGEAIVLLKNTDNILPLDVGKIKTIAVIGPNARWAQIMGGGSSSVTPHYAISPLEGIRRRAGNATEVGYSVGCLIHRYLPVIDITWLHTKDRLRNGLEVALFDNLQLIGEPSGAWFTNRGDVSWITDYLVGVNPTRFSARLTATLVVPESGVYSFSLLGNGQYRLYIDGQVLIDHWSAKHEDTTPWEEREKKAQINLDADKSYDFKIDYSWEGSTPWRQLRIGCLPPVPTSMMQEAVELAKRSDVAILVAGLSKEWESEGFDRIDMDLCGEQAELIARVASANPNTIVVLNVGSPVQMPWLGQVKAVLQSWYLGQETGNAIADILFGDVNPSGKLPTTFSKRLEDNPAYINYPGENGKVLYGEGLFVGYRYYDKKDVVPQFPFGYGLSYTTFKYSNLRINNDRFGPGDTIQVSVDVTNAGSRAGMEIVQLYVRDIQSSLVRPIKELKGFTKVALEPGMTTTATFILNQESLAFYNDARKAWVTEAGEFELMVGSSSRDIHLTGRFEWTSEAVDAMVSDKPRLNISLPIKDLLENKASKAILAKYLGPLLDHPQLEMAMSFSLEQVASFVPDMLTPEVMGKIDEELRKL
jgi:beta-glucosidase